ncbi:LytR/AlgR family response regulator transcription factor [Marinicella meishanensis]|uniref:LytR/AlgR family response regulator transcription factor n=1 Tax=Marinicella meishanensis TaxID=2873263 RepID=UPI001CC12DC7|nr:LytTR family DNA-binding domain-containing protein [Marinicella sp. NBU2979]
MQTIKRHPSNTFIIVFAAITCASMMVFEAAQQLFYVRLYEISLTATFLDLFTSQIRKWLLFLLFAIPLWWHIKKLADLDELHVTDILKTIGLIFVLLFAVILSMSVVEIAIVGDAFTAHRIWAEYFTFYTFQKVPTYVFGYTFLSMVFYLHSKNNQLTVQVLKLSELTQKDLNMYYQHKAAQDQNTSVLKIKVGNTYKIVSIEDIDWIEADDYCVNIHCQEQDMVYSMRATLKSLEAMLPPNFLRVHRSAIVNMDGVEAYQTKGSGLITLKSGDEIAVAQSKIKAIKEFFAVEQG